MHKIFHKADSRHHCFGMKIYTVKLTSIQPDATNVAAVVDELVIDADRRDHTHLAAHLWSLT